MAAAMELPLSQRPILIALLGVVVLLLLSPSAAARRTLRASGVVRFSEAPHFRNGDSCPRVASGASVCDPARVHVAMTLDSSYLRGTVAAVHSLLRHASCPSNLFLHFITAADDALSRELRRTIGATFPSLRFSLYPFDESLVKEIISPSVREALQRPLNFARSYLAELLDPCVGRVIYLDSDIIVVDDITKLWNVPLEAPAVLAAPEYCHANFTSYFTAQFWDSGHSTIFESRSRSPCYFNTGVMVMDLQRWRQGEHRQKIEEWMRIQKKMRIYELGSLPAFLLEFAGEVEPVGHQWNQHGLGGDNGHGSCRKLHPGPVSLLHWSGKGKPWDRLDARKPCDVDRLWSPYDLYRPASARININRAVFS